MRSVNNIKALVTLGSYAIKDGLENQLIKTYGKLGENRMYQLQMAVVRIGLRRYRNKMIMIGLGLVVIKLFYQLAYKPVVEMIITGLFMLRGNYDEGTYKVHLNPWGIEFEWLAIIWEPYRFNKPVQILWGSALLVPQFLVVGDPQGGNPD